MRSVARRPTPGPVARVLDHHVGHRQCGGLMTTTELSRYTTQLIRRLRWRHVPRADIDDAVAVVESHVRDTGQRPEQEFGSAREYAQSFPRRDVPEHWPRHIAALVIGTLAGMLLITAISAQTRGD